MDLNPIHGVTDGYNAAKHLGGEAVSAAHNLAGDAYDTGSGLVKTSAKVGGDLTHLEISDAFKDAGKGAVEAGKGAWHLVDDQTKFVIAAHKTFDPIGGRALDLVNVAARSALNTAVLHPADGIANLGGKAVNAVTGIELPRLELHADTGAEKHGIAGKIAHYAGDAAGFVAPFLMTGGTLSSIGAASKAFRGGEDALAVPFGKELPAATKGIEMGPRYLSQTEVNSLWAQQAKADGVFSFRKGYYEANLTKVDAAKFPDGIVFSSSEKPIRVAEDFKLANGETVKAGTELPNGTQLSNGKLVAPSGEVKLSDGTTITKDDIASMKLADGAKANPNDYIIQRPSTDDFGNPRIDTYAQNEATMQKKWVAVEAKPGVYAPKVGSADPVEMTRIPEGMKVKFMAEYGEDVANEGPAWLVKSGDGHYIITERDLRETYVGATSESQARMEKILDNASRNAGQPVPRAG